MAERVRKELGVRLPETAWALVEFENGARVVVRGKDGWEKIPEQ